jgi:hypothetical protein
LRRALAIGTRPVIEGDVGVCNYCLGSVRFTAEGMVVDAGRLSNWDEYVLDVTREVVRRRRAIATA